LEREEKSLTIAGLVVLRYNSIDRSEEQASSYHAKGLSFIDLSQAYIRTENRENSIRLSMCPKLSFIDISSFFSTGKYESKIRGTERINCFIPATINGASSGKDQIV